jgi:hypothetical protein
MWWMLAWAVAAAEPEYIDALVAPGLEGCEVTWRGKTTVLDCLGTKAATIPKADVAEAEAAVAGLVKAYAEKGFTPLYPDDEALRDRVLPLPPIEPPLTAVSRLEGNGERMLVAASGTVVLQCAVVDGAVSSCAHLLKRMLADPRPPVGQHPLVLFGHPFLGHGCVLGRDLGLRCLSGTLWAQRRHDPEDLFDGFSSVARSAVDVDCRFLGTARRCRAALERPPGVDAHRTLTPAEAWLAVWIEHDDMRIVCRSEGPAMSPLCATVFGPVAFANATTAKAIPSVPAPKPKDPLSRCRRSTTATDLVAVCPAAFMSAFAALAPDAPVPPVVRVGDHEAVRFAMNEKGPTLTMQTPRGQAAGCEIGAMPLERARERCADVVAALAAGDTRPFVFVRRGLRYSAPRTCTKTLETVIVCGEDNFMLHDSDKVADFATAVRSQLQAPIDVPCRLRREASEARCVRGGFATDGKVSPFLVVEAPDLVVTCALPRQRPTGPCADVVTFATR